MTNYVLIVGSPSGGFNLYGPFLDSELAIEHANEFPSENWWVDQLMPAGDDPAYPPPFVVIEDGGGLDGDPVVVGPFVYEGDAVEWEKQGPERTVTQLWSPEQHAAEEHTNE